MHISTMLVFWSLASLVQNSVVLAIYLLFSVSCFFTVHEHYIKVYIRNYNEMLSISIENSVEKEVRIKNGRPVSADEKGSGIGCLNVERCVEKYGGNILYKNGDGKFYSDVILNR